MKHLIHLTLFAILFVVVGCKTLPDYHLETEKQHINTLLNQWHIDAATFLFDDYFNKMTDDAVFVGTDATEVWSKAAFMRFSQPFFEQRHTWDFKPIHRNLYLDYSNHYVAFDELLQTWMGLCRGSGVVVRTPNGWKIKHYVLSVAVPNEDIQAVIKAKKTNDSLTLYKLTN